MEHQYIGFWKRTLALILDQIAFFIILAPVMTLMFGLEYWIPAQDPADLYESLMESSISLFITVALVLGFWIVRSATPGKILMEAIIVDAETGGKPTIGQWIIRYLGYIVSMLPLCLGYIWVAFDSRKQGWHDKLAGTVVIQEPEEVPISLPEPE